MIPLSHLSVARFSGKDVSAFLQSQLSADINALEPGDSTFAAYCSPRGQVLGLLLVCKQEDHFLLASASELLPGLCKRLGMFVMRSKVQIDPSPGLVICGLPAGEKAPSAFSVFSPGNLSLNYVIGDSTFNEVKEIDIWKCEELQQGVTWLDARTAENFIPQMLGLETIGAVSFTKGCYPGQEIVARTRYLGKVKRKPLIVTTLDEVVIDSGARLEINYAAQSTNGTLIDSAVNENGNTVLFIVTNLVDDETPESITLDDQTHLLKST